MADTLVHQGPYASEPVQWRATIHDDDWVFSLERNGDSATLLYAYYYNEQPWEVTFEGVSIFEKVEEQFAEQYMPQYVTGDSHGKTWDGEFLSVSGNEDSPLFQVHYQSATERKLEWVECNGRRFEGKGLDKGKGGWKERLIAYTGVIVFGILFLLYELSKR